MEVEKISPALREPEFNREDNKIFKSKIYAVCQVSATEKNKAGDGAWDGGRTSCSLQQEVR